MRLSRALSRGRQARPLQGLEELETRRLLTIVVDDGGDISDPNDGKTTLREAVEEANAGGVDEDIEFTCEVPDVTLSQGPLSVGGSGHDITIDGMLDCPDEGGMVTVNADSQFRVFNIDDGDGGNQTAGVILRSLNITGGAAVEGGGILNRETLTLLQVNLFGNTATSPGPPFTSYGGGLSNIDGSVDLVDSTITDNLATSAIPMESPAFGGGFASRGDDSRVTMFNTTVGANTSMGNGGGIFFRGGMLKLDFSSVRDNKAGGVDDASHHGGGVALFGGIAASPLDVEMADVTITGNVVANNSMFLPTEPSGGGLYARGNGQLRMVRTTLSENETRGDVLGNASVSAEGGGALLAAESFTGAPLLVNVQDAQINANTAGTDGGGLFAKGGVSALLDIDIANSSLNRNTAGGDGGAVLARAPGATAPGLVDLALTDSVVSENFAANGAISNGMSGRITIERTTIDANTVFAFGGGIHNQGTLGPAALQPITQIRNSTVSHNSAGFNGGGIFNQAGILELFQSTLSGNQAFTGGGGYLASLDPVAEGGAAAVGGTNFTIIDRSTITQNTAVFGGGGLAVEGQHGSGSSINSTIVADNIDLGGLAPDIFEFGFAGTPLVANTLFSLIGIADGSSFVPGNPSTNGNFVGSGNNPLAPLLTGLVDAGGQTQVHVPTAGSPAIDNGDPSVLGGFDQLGQQRVRGGRMDIGSVETLDTLPDCDINQDGSCDCQDLDLLSAELASGGNALMFDLDGSGVVDFDDLLVWLADAGARPEHFAATGGNPFLLGDANLDGTVDGGDFLLWNLHKFSASDAYCDGDFNADGSVDGEDFLIWNTNKFQSSDRPAKPEVIPPVAAFQLPLRFSHAQRADLAFRDDDLFLFRDW